MAYLPILSINNPASVSFYLEFICKVVTFDPIPEEYFLAGLDIFFDFDWVDNE